MNEAGAARAYLEETEKAVSKEVILVQAVSAEKEKAVLKIAARFKTEIEKDIMEIVVAAAEIQDEDLQDALISAAEAEAAVSADAIVLVAAEEILVIREVEIGEKDIN